MTRRPFGWAGLSSRDTNLPRTGPRASIMDQDRNPAVFGACRVTTSIVSLSEFKANAAQMLADALRNEGHPASDHPHRR